MDSPRVPAQIIGSPRVDAALKFAAGADPAGDLASSLRYLCEVLSSLCSAPVASVYVLEGRDDLVLRGNFGFPARAIGEVRLTVGQGITGTAVETLRPVSVDDAGLTAQFAYFPQLAEERYPAFLAVPLLDGARPLGALVLQREQGPFTEADVLLALSCGRTLAALLDGERTQGAQAQLTGTGNGCGRTLGMVRLLSRALARREGRTRLDAAERAAAIKKLVADFAAERDELRELIAKARSAATKPAQFPIELETVIEDERTVERVSEHIEAGLSPSQAFERIAAESARTLAPHGPLARRALEVEALATAVAHRYAGLTSDRIRRGELLVGVQIPTLVALRGWEQGAVGALCAGAAEESPGVALFTALGLPAVSGLRALFDRVGNGEKVALDAATGQVLVNPSAADAAGWRR
jgi:phosphotransferase system enzyme I (PtsP)